MLLQGCPHPPQAPPPVAWPNALIAYYDGLLVASSIAFQSWFRCVETAALCKSRKVHMSLAPVNVGRHTYGYGPLIHGISSKPGATLRRTHWHQKGIRMPFEQLRQSCLLYGEFVVLTYSHKAAYRRGPKQTRPVVLRFTMEEIMGPCAALFTVHKITPTHGKYKDRVCDVFVYGKLIEWHALNIVPF